MRRLSIALAVVVASGCAPKAADNVDSTTPPAAVSASPAANTKADEDSIRALNARILSAMSSHDTAAISALYADDGVDFTPNMTPARGRSALVKEYADLFGAMKDLKMSMNVGDIMVAQSGDLAISRAAYDMTWTDAKGKPAKDHGNVLVGWKKVNGAWKIATSMNASDTPMPAI